MRFIQRYYSLASVVSIISQFLSCCCWDSTIANPIGGAIDPAIPSHQQQLWVDIGPINVQFHIKSGAEIDPPRGRAYARRDDDGSNPSTATCPQALRLPDPHQLTTLESQPPPPQGGPVEPQEDRRGCDRFGGHCIVSLAGRPSTRLDDPRVSKAHHTRMVVDGERAGSGVGVNNAAVQGRQIALAPLQLRCSPIHPSGGWGADRAG